MSKLKAIDLVVNAINNSTLCWCHWKSNDKLHSTYQGDTDLDLLFHRVDIEKVKNLMESIGAVEFKTCRYRRHQWISDFYIIDKQTGKLVHLHLHFGLSVGEKQFKDFELPFTDDILAARRLVAESDFWIPSPEHEYILLMLRLALRQPRFTSSRRSDTIIPNAYLKEIKWLIPQINGKRLRQYVKNWVPSKELARIVLKIADNYKDYNSSELKRAAHNIYQGYRTTTVWVRFYKATMLNIYVRLERIPFVSWFLSSKKRLAHSGQDMILVLTGLDGSGKTTLLDSIEQHLSKEFTVRRFYFGHGKSGRSIIVRSTQFLAGVINRFTPKYHAKLQYSYTAKAVLAMGFSIHKTLSLITLKIASAAGMIILVDRFPQVQNTCYSDGLINLRDDNKKNFFAVRLIEKLQRKVFSAIISFTRPTLIAKLQAGIDILVNRKPSTVNRLELEAQMDIFKRLIFAPNASHITIDTGSVSIEEASRVLLVLLWKEFGIKYRATSENFKTGN